jgi:hypothetical protein
MNRPAPVNFIFIVLIIQASLAACNGNEAAQKAAQQVEDGTKAPIRKPPATLQDTLLIDRPAAVFYHPDSIQLRLMKQRLKPMQYESNMHEFFYQLRNARMVIKKNWPALTVMEAKGYRFILFKKKDGLVSIDLDTLPDPYGLLIFNTVKDPVPVDMTNLETGVSFYLR